LQQFKLVGLIETAIFADYMKRIAAFILIIFTLVQAAPAMQCLFNKFCAVPFSIDEEENGMDKKIENTKKENKDYHPFISYSVKVVSLKTSVAFHEAEKIFPFPCLKKLTPPPNA
jgi:hypothetical protein